MARSHTLTEPAGRLGSRLVAPLLVGAGGVAAVAALAVRDPHVPGAWGYCPWLAITGIYCPGCGGLRAVNDLVHFRFLDAIGSNLFAVLFVVAGAVGWFYWLQASWTARPLRWPVPARWVWAVLAALVVFSIARNLPWFAFLAP